MALFPSGHLLKKHVEKVQESIYKGVLSYTGMESQLWQMERLAEVKVNEVFG